MFKFILMVFFCPLFTTVPNSAGLIDRPLPTFIGIPITACRPPISGNEVE